MSDIVNKEAIEALISDNPGLNRIPVRIDKGTQKASVIDIIRMVSGQSGNHASKMIQRLDPELIARCNRVRINGKGRLTFCADYTTCMDIISTIPGVNAKAVQLSYIQQGITLKRKLSDLISNGNVNIAKGNTTLKLQLSSATIEHKGKQIKRWDYLEHVSPSTEEVIQLIELIFPTEFVCGNNAPTQGIVYFIRIHNTDLVKIGFTTQPIETRLSQLQIAHPGHLLVDFTYHTKEYRQQERALHRLLHSCHVRGEWFCLNEDIRYQDILTCLK
jgi:hypothetical protein